MLRLVGSITPKRMRALAQRRCRLQGLLVDDRHRAPARPADGACRRAARTRPRRSSRRRGAGWRGPWATPASPRLPAAPGPRARRRRSRPGRRGRWRGRSGICEAISRSGRRSRPTLESFTVTRSQAPRLAALRASWASETLSSAAMRRPVSPRDARRGLIESVDRLLGQLDPVLLHRQELRRRLDPDVQAPLASTRIRASAPTASRTAATCSTSPAHADLQLEGAESLAGPALAPARRPPPALRRSGSRCSGPARRSPAPSSLQAGTPAALARRSSSAVSTAQRAGGERWALSARRIPVPQLGDDGLEPRPAAQRQRHGLAQPLDPVVVANPQQDHLPPAARVPRAVTYGSRKGSAYGTTSVRGDPHRLRRRSAGRRRAAG